MSSYIGSIADALATALTNASAGSSADLSQSFTAERVYTPETEFATLGTELRVEVFARASESERRDRAGVKKEIEIDVMFMKRVAYGTDTTDPDANAELDALMQLGEEIVELLADPNTRYSGSQCLRTESDPIYDFEILRTHRAFVGLIKAYFLRA